MAIKICERIYDKDTCPGYVNGFGTIMLTNLVQRQLNPKIVCNDLKLCNFEIKHLKIEDFANEILNENK